MDQAYVYIVECADGTLYTGWTRNVAQRIKAHNGEAPNGAKYTRPRRPVILRWSRLCESKQEAQSIEVRIKRLSRLAKERLITKDEVPQEWLFSKEEN